MDARGKRTSASIRPRARKCPARPSAPRTTMSTRSGSRGQDPLRAVTGCADNASTAPTFAATESFIRPPGARRSQCNRGPESSGVDGTRYRRPCGRSQADAESMFRRSSDLMAGAGLAEPRLPPGRGRGHSRRAIRASYVFNTTIAGYRTKPTPCLADRQPIRAARRPVLNARLRKRHGSTGGFPRSGSSARLRNLTYRVPATWETPGPETLRELGGRPASASADVLDKARRRPMLILGDGRARATRRRRRCYSQRRNAWRRRERAGRSGPRVERIQRPAHRRRVEGRRPRSRVRSRRRRRRGYRSGILEGAGKGEIQAVYPARRRRDRHPSGLAEAFVIYQGHHGDAGAACEPT